MPGPSDGIGVAIATAAGAVVGAAGAAVEVAQQKAKQVVSAGAQVVEKAEKFVDDRAPAWLGNRKPPPHPLDGYDVLFIRHGNTAPNPIDTERILTEKGRKQCESAAKTYMKTLPCMELASFAVTSPAVRCIETASLVLAGSPTPIEPVHCPAVYDALLQPGASGIFKKISYAPMSDYLAEGPEVKDILDSYAESVLSEVEKIVTARAEAEAEAEAELRKKIVGAVERRTSRKTLCVFGHAVYSASVAHMLATQRGLAAPSIDAILSYNMQEACGFWVGAEEAKVLVHDLAGK